MPSPNWWETPWDFFDDFTDALIGVVSAQDITNTMTGVEGTDGISLAKDWLEQQDVETERAVRGPEVDATLAETKGRLPVARYHTVAWEATHDESGTLHLEMRERVSVYASKSTSQVESMKYARQIALALSAQLVLATHDRFINQQSVLQTFREYANGWPFSVTVESGETLPGPMGKAVMTVNCKHTAPVPSGV